MRRLKLTTEKVKTELKKAKARIIWDQEIPGLGLRVRPSATGTKGWFVFTYRVKARPGAPADRTVRWLTLGEYGRPHTAEDGRKWGREKRDLLDKGKDPGAVETPAPRPEDAIPTLAGYVDRYLERKESGACHKSGKPAKASSLRVDRGNLDRIVRDYPKVASKRLHEITKADIETIVRRKDHPVTGNRWLALLRHLFNVAAADAGAGFTLRAARVDGSAWANPCRDIGATEEKPREPRPGPDVWPRLFALLDKYSRQPTEAELKESRKRAQLARRNGASRGESVSEANPIIAALIRMQALTGARGSELRTARWSLLRIHESTPDKPDEKPIRTGTLTVIEPKEGGEKLIPLSAEAVRVIDKLPRIGSCDFLFAGQSGKEPIEQTTVLHWWARHRDEAGLKAFRLHDLRHFVAGELVAAGASLTQIGELFGHKSPTTTARYAYLDDARKKDLAALVAGRITSKAEAQA